MSIWNNSVNLDQLLERTPVFPEGLRVLAIDANAVCLKLLVRLLEVCRYQVTWTKNPLEALEKIRENKEMFDIIITDVKNLDMDGFSLLDIVVIETDLPVIMTSSDDSESTVMKGIRHGARDYLLKPVRLEVIRNIWQHVVRKALANNTTKLNDITNYPNKEECERNNIENKLNVQSSPIQKRQKRMVWSNRLHQKFVDAIEILGDNAVPKQILQLMNEPTLTRANVASHLQKFRNMLNCKANTVENSSSRDTKVWRYPGLNSEANQMRGYTDCRQQLGSTSGMQTPMQDNQFGKVSFSHGDQIHKLSHSLFPLQQHQQNKQNFCVPQISPGPPPPPFLDQLMQRRVQMRMPENGSRQVQPWTANNYQNMQDSFSGIKYFPSYNNMGSECGQSSVANYPQVSRQIAYPDPSSLFDLKYRMLANGASNSTVEATFPQQNSVSMPRQSCLIGNHYEETFNYKGHDALDRYPSMQTDPQEIIDTEGGFTFSTRSSSEEDLTALVKQFGNEENGGLES